MARPGLRARQGDVTLTANAVLFSAPDGFAFLVEALAGSAFRARRARARPAVVLSAARCSASSMR